MSIFVPLTGQFPTVQALPMSEDQKPSQPDEKARITKAGGFVMNGRVLGVLAVSRAFGDKKVTTFANKCMLV